MEITAFVRGPRVGVSEVVHLLRVRIEAAMNAAFEGDSHIAGFKAVEEGLRHGTQVVVMEMERTHCTTML